MLKDKRGFTLIELVLVIVVLGILAAVGIPRYVNLAQQARIAGVNGMAAGVRSSVAVVRAQYMALGTLTSPVNMLDGTTVAVSTGAAGGVPTGAAGGIDNAVQDFTGFTFAAGAPSTFTPTNGGSATCRVEYTAATGLVVAQIAGC